MSDCFIKACVVILDWFEVSPQRATMKTLLHRSRRAAFLRALYLMVCLASLSAFAQELSQRMTDTGVTSSLPRGIVVQNTDVVGQVYIASERPADEDEPARNVSVRVIIPESGDVLFETRTDKNGGYVIPRLKPGAYRLHIGALQIAFFVENLAPSNPQLPKVVISILPRDMVRRQ